MKNIFTRDLKNFKSPYKDPFEYLSLLQKGEPYFLDAFKRVSLKNGNDFIKMKELAGPAFEPRTWKLALLGRDLVGL